MRLERRYATAAAVAAVTNAPLRRYGDTDGEREARKRGHQERRDLVPRGIPS